MSALNVTIFLTCEDLHVWVSVSGVTFQREKLNVKLKQMKQTLDDEDEEVAHVNSQKRKVQRELDEAEEPVKHWNAK